MSILHVRHPASGAIALALLVALQGACALRKPIDPIDPNIYASGSAFVYQPINPTTIWVGTPGDLKAGETAADFTAPEFNTALLRDLDTETVRISLSKASGSVSATAAVAGASVKGESYVLIADYIKYFASTRQFAFDYKVKVPDATTKGKLSEETRSFRRTIPIYSGIGVRVRAEFSALESGLDISGLPALAVAAKANHIAGRLTMQTLGISGPEVSPLMVFLSDISVSSIQSAVQAVSAVKAKMYEPSTSVYPKLVGFEAPADQLDAIPALTSKLYELDLTMCPKKGPRPGSDAGSKEKIVWIAWDPGCENPPKAGNIASAPVTP